jgi:two-component system sensor histidine kinase MprB
VSLRLRVTVTAAVAVLVVVVVLSVVVYALVRDDLRDQIDDSLDRNSALRTVEVDGVLGGPALAERSALGDLFADRFLQVVDREGNVVSSVTDRALPVPDEVTDLAGGGEGADLFYDSAVDGTPVRVYAAAVGDGYVVQFGRSLTELNKSLRQLVVVLATISALGTGLAVVVGRLVASAAVSPVHALSSAAETIARTGNPSHHIDVSSRDELGRLARSFNTMLDALAASLAQQRHLVADASHELRTPLASVRTNIEVLQRADGLDPGERQQLLTDVVAQIAEQTRLVEDLVELARGQADEEPFESLDLDGVVADVVDRARRNHPAVEFEVLTSASRSPVRGVRRQVNRAITNLVDNAAKWSPAGGRVRIDVIGGAIAVSDQGPGIDPADVPHVFDRFYRAAPARSMPGSGLGLAIVKQVADGHGGDVTVDRSPEGGARFVLRLPRD